MALVCTSCGTEIGPGSDFYADVLRQFYCGGCWTGPGTRGSTEIRPESLSHREQVNQRVVKTATALREAGQEYRACQKALDLAQKACDDAGRRWEHLCRQMAEAASSWAILREKERRG